tara:strand:+ start:255 stop:479 length:225 start_codon:yes stop_codon:yes gene_type:complete
MAHAKDLSNHLQAVYSAEGLEAKKEAMAELIDFSAARTLKKESSRFTLSRLTSAAKIDTFATNYMMSGEGMSVA